MSINKKQKIKDELILFLESAIRISDANLMNELRNHTIFPLTQNSCIAFPDKSIKETTKKILSTLKDEYPISDETIYNYIIKPCISLHIKTNQTPDDKIIVDCIDYLEKNFLLDEWEIFRPIYGVGLTKESEIVLGRYFIRKQHEYEKHIESQKISPKLNLNGYEEEPYLIASVKVEARESSLAIAQADFLFQRLENILRYMIASFQDELDIGIFNYSGIELSQALCVSSKSFQTFSQVRESLNPVFLDNTFPVNIAIKDPDRKQHFEEESFFLNNSMGHKRIWEITKKSSIKTKNDNDMSGMEKRILTAVEWIGKGMRDIDPSRAFTQLIFALEALFVYQEKNVLVNPGIANQISEYSAFILGNTVQERIDVEKQVKELYAKRSSIVHGGNSEISRQDCIKAYIIVNGILVRLNTDEKLLKLQKAEDLNQWIKSRKYSS